MDGWGQGGNERGLVVRNSWLVFQRSFFSCLLLCVAVADIRDVGRLAHFQLQFTNLDKTQRRSFLTFFLILLPGTGPSKMNIICQYLA